MTKESQNDDQLIGGNIAVLRGERTQKELAEAMRERGFKWSQSTVWSVESGERSLKFVEAVALAQILPTQMEYLAREQGFAIVQTWARQVGRDHAALISAVLAYNESMSNLAVAGDEALKSGELNGHLKMILTSWIGRTALEVVRDAESGVLEDSYVAESPTSATSPMTGQGRYLDLLVKVRFDENCGGSSDG